MNVIKHLFLATFIFVLSACASAPKFSGPISPKSGMAAIYVYRPWTFSNGAGAPVVQLDAIGEEKLVNGGWLRFESAPGQHKVAIAERYDFMMAKTWPPVSIDIKAEANKTYYVRFSTASEIIPGYISYLKYEFAFQQIPEEFALKELNKQKQ